MDRELEAAAGEDDLRKQAIKRIKQRRDFRRHLVIYVIVNAALWALWAIDGADTSDLFPAWVMGIWGIFVIFDAWETFGERPISDADVEEEMRRLGGR